MFVTLCKRERERFICFIFFFLLSVLFISSFFYFSHLSYWKWWSVGALGRGKWWRRCLGFWGFWQHGLESEVAFLFLLFKLTWFSFFVNMALGLMEWGVFSLSLPLPLPYPIFKVSYWCGSRNVSSQGSLGKCGVEILFSFGKWDDVVYFKRFRCFLERCSPLESFSSSRPSWEIDSCRPKTQDPSQSIL